MNTLITPTLVQQAAVALVSSVVVTVVPLLSSLEAGGGDGAGDPTAFNATATSAT